MTSATAMARNYAKALSTLIARSPKLSDKYVVNLITHLKKTGRIKLLPHIHTALVAGQRRREAINTVIEIAGEEDRLPATKAGAEMGLKDVRIVKCPELLRGWRIRTKDTLLDTSAKNNLLQMYYHIINTH